MSVQPAPTTPKRLWFSTRLRLALSFAAISVLSAVALFGFTFYSLYRTLQQDDLRDTQQQLLRYWAQYQAGGIDQLRREFDTDGTFFGERAYFLRIADADNRTLLYAYPAAWESFEFPRLEHVPPTTKSLIILRSDEFDHTLEISGLWLSPNHFMQLGISTQTRLRLLRLFQRSFVVIASAVVVAGFVVGFLTASQALRPVFRLTEAAREVVTTARLSARIEPVSGGGELAQLVDLFNAMLERIERLVDGLKHTVDMVAHDLRTPITRLRSVAELALADPDPVETRVALEEVIEQSAELLRLINTLMDITEAESGVLPLNRTQLELRRLFEEVTDLYELAAEEQGVGIKIACDVATTIYADRVRMRQVLANLVDNAVKFSRPHGMVRLAAYAENTETVIEVSDEGVGMSAEELEHAFERMYRGRVQPRQRGLGLGLSLVKAVVEAHGALVAAESTPGVGSVFRIRFRT